MENKEMIVMQNSDGVKTEAELVTYLINEDNTGAYVVYTNREEIGPENDVIIYVSKIVTLGDVIQTKEIVDDNEWAQVQTMLKRIANAN